MSIKNEFSKYANQYDNNNIIQRIVSKALIRECNSNPKRILELGCGSGQIFRNIDWEIDYYKAIDFSPSMCELHPKDTFIDVKCFDFDSEEFWEDIKDEYYDVIFSSSALQWSKDLTKLLTRLLSITNNIKAVLFTSNTFKTIYNITKQTPPILSLEDIQNKCLKVSKNCEFEVFNYKLEFKNKKELFRYIKNSGVKGNIKLSFKDAKNLYQNYPLNYLEFEVIFIKMYK